MRLAGFRFIYLVLAYFMSDITYVIGLLYVGHVDNSRSTHFITRFIGYKNIIIFLAIVRQLKTQLHIFDPAFLQTSANKRLVDYLALNLDMHAIDYELVLPLSSILLRILSYIIDCLID